jgi:hypothetical protein
MLRGPEDYFSKLDTHNEPLLTPRLNKEVTENREYEENYSYCFGVHHLLWTAYS